MKAILTCVAFAAMGSMALAQTEQRPVGDPLSVKPIATQAQTTDTDRIRSDPIEDRTDGLYRRGGSVARQHGRLARQGQEGNRNPRRHHRQGRPHQAWTAIARAPSVEARRQLDDC